MLPVYMAPSLLECHCLPCTSGKLSKVHPKFWGGMRLHSHQKLAVPYSTTNKNTIQIHSDNLDFHGPVIPFTKDLFQIRGESEREYMAETSNECARPTPL